MPDDLLTRNKNLNRGFRKLEIWNLAIGLSNIHSINYLDSKKSMIFNQNVES